MLIPFYKESSEIPEQYTDLYKENEQGIHVLQVEPKDGYALENLAPLKNALTRQKERGDEYKTKLQMIPENFDFDANARKLKQLETQQGFNPDEERKAIKLEVQKNFQDEFKLEIEKKDAQMQSLKRGIEQSAREGVYAEASKIGIDKMLLQSYLESQTVVNIDDKGYSLAFVNPDGTPRHTPQPNGDVTPYNTGDFLKDLSKHDVYGKLVKTDANSGDGGNIDYQNQNINSGKKVISDSNVGNNLEDIASGKAVRAE